MISQTTGERAQARHSSRIRRRLVRGGLAIGALGIAALIAVPALAPTSTTGTSSAFTHSSSSGIFSDSLRPAVAVDSDRVSVELGLKFSPEQTGDVTALQYFQNRAASGVTSATLWTSTGDKLASVTFPASKKEGWRTISLKSPVSLAGGSSYVVSYHAPNGSYAVTEGDLSAKKTVNGFTLTPGAGVYTYGTAGFPTSTYRASNYLVDIVYQANTTAADAPATAPRPVVTATPTPVKTTTPTPTPTPSLVPMPAPVPVVPSVPAPGGSTAGSAGWTINANTVGLAPLGLTCSSLPVYTGSSSIPAGTTITGKRFTGGLDLSAGNITIENSCIQPTSAGRGMPVVATQDFNTFKIAPSKVTIRNSEFDGSKLAIQDAAWATAFIGVADLTSNYVHGFGSGIAIMNSGSSLDAKVEGNYVTGLVAWGNPATTGNHSDAFTIRDFTNRSRADRQLTVVNNRFNADSGSDTGALFIQTYSGSIDNVLIQGNLLEGNGYQLGLNQMNDSYSNLRSVNNRFSGTGFGATYAQGGSGWTQWDSNYIYKSSATDSKGAVVSEP